jgi:carbon-monoxide dehydrogenase medium subunit
MIPAPFDYYRPRSIEEALALLAAHPDDGRVIAGGHSLIPMMKLRLATPGHLIDLRGIGGLAAIAEADGALVIGALATQEELARSPLLAERCPILRETALQIADPQVRYCGTIGGNVANGDPGNDMPAVMQALGAAYLLRGPAGERSVAARDFYQAPYVTALAEGEILTGIRIAPPAAGHGWAYAKMKRKVGDYATAAAAVLLELDADGTCRKAAVALTNVGDTPVLAAAAGAALAGSRLEPAAIEAAAAAAMAVTRPAGDGRGPPEFRTHVAGVMVRRAIETARQRARKG